jgi:hypothetical protein
VVHDKKEESAQPFLSVSQRDGSATPLAGSIIAEKLTLQELDVIETFLNRRLDLPPAIREQSAKRIADAIAARLEVPAEERKADEEFLEVVARDFRNTARFRV